MRDVGSQLPEDGGVVDGRARIAAAGTHPGGNARLTAEAASGARADGTDRVAEAKVLYDKAHDAMDESNFARALELADASLRMRRTARTYLLRAQAEQRLDHVDQALASVEAAAQIAPDLGAVWETRGRILWAARRREQARAAFEKFLQLEPDGARAAAVRHLMNEPR
jgi:tetratricopeptide (TPR) repeat protein